MSNNPFTDSNNIRVEASNLIDAALANKGISAKVFPGRTIPNLDELPAVRAYLSEPKKTTALAKEDRKTEAKLRVDCLVPADRFNPDAVIDNIMGTVWDTLDEVKLNTSKDRLIATDFDYDVDAESSIATAFIDFKLTY